MARLEQWGTIADGTPVMLATLYRSDGLSVRVSSYGATLTSIRAPDRNGRLDEVLLGFDELAGYLSPHLQARWPYLGSTIGRFANRIGGAEFAINGTSHTLSANDNGHHLHGGFRGFDRRVWASELMMGVEGVRLSLISPDGDEGYPGRVLVHAEFIIDNEGGLVVRYTATTDAPTHINITSHGYFNLGGRAARSIANHELEITAAHYLPIDASALPTGELADVRNSAFDLNRPVRLKDVLTADHAQIVAAGGLNHCFTVANGGRAAVLHDPSSGRRLELTTSAPGLLVYTANAFDGSVIDDGGRPFVRHQAIALEAQGLPDSPSQPKFPSSLLKPGEIYSSRTRLCFLID